MSREIKFRGLTPQGEWVYGSLVIHHNDEYYIHPEFSAFIGELIDVTSETVGQFTGVKDIEEKEIYEGDSVSVNGTECVVEYNPNKYGYCAFYVVGKEFIYSLSVEGEIFVIGNIHEKKSNS